MNFKLNLAVNICIIIILLYTFGLQLPIEQSNIIEDQYPQTNLSSPSIDIHEHKKISKVASVSADEDIPISLGFENKYTPATAVDTEGNLWTVYSYYNTTHYLLDIFKSTNGGVDWTKEVFIYSDYLLENPDIAIDLYDNNIYCVYETAEASNASSHDIVIFRYNQWDIVDVDADSFDQRNPSIAIDPNYGANNYIYVAYEQLTNNNNREMIIRKSADHGSSWGDGWHYRGFIDTYVHTQMDIAVDFSGQVYLTYAYGGNYTELKYIVVESGSRDSIDIYFENVSFVYYTPSYTLNYPTIAVSRSSSITTKVVIAFEYEWDKNDHDIMVVSSNDGGYTWNSSLVAFSFDWEGRPNVISDRMDTNSSTNTDGHFYLVYAKRYQGLNDTFIILSASYASPTSWRKFHSYEGTKYIWNNTKRVFGMATYSNGSYNLIISYAATSCYGCVDTQIYSTIVSRLNTSFTITSPSSTTKWTPGTIETITWSSIGTINYVNIFLYKGNSPLGWIAQEAENLGYYDWGIPDFLEPGTDYWMDIEDANNTDIYAFSSQFEIIEITSTNTIVTITITTIPPIPTTPPTARIYFTNPTPVSAWRAGATYIITWNCKAPLEGDVTLELLKGGNSVEVLSRKTDGESHFKWEIPEDMVEGDDYQIRVFLNSDTSVYGISNNFKVINSRTSQTALSRTLILPTPGYDLTFLIFSLIIFIMYQKKRVNSKSD